jgi:hypothetical protein
MDKWNEICFLIKKHSKENSKEAFFQSEVVNIFEKLGWSRYRNEIETEKQTQEAEMSEKNSEDMVNALTEQFKEFRAKYKVLEDKMRPLVYELGFLLK